MPTTSQAEPMLASPESVIVQNRIIAIERKAYDIFGSLPRRDVHQLATERVHTQTMIYSGSLHVNATGCVDVVVSRKDLSKESHRLEETGYHRRLAGPGPQYDQREQVRYGGVPADVMEEIRQTGDHHLIAQWLGPFINFWPMTWAKERLDLATVFYFAKMATYNPTLVIGESSHVGNIFLHHSEKAFNGDAAASSAFHKVMAGEAPDIDAILTPEYMQYKWDDLDMASDAWTVVKGNLCIRRYGPAGEFSTIYLPKPDAYRPYHTQTLSAKAVEVDRWTRVIAHLARRNIRVAGAIPHGGPSRLKALREILAGIVKDGEALQIFEKMDAAEVSLRQDEACFRRDAALRSTSNFDHVTAMSVNMVTRAERATRPPGAPGSDERKVWVTDNINEARQRREDGERTEMIPTPRCFEHLSDDHARWLFQVPKEGKDVERSAQGYEMGRAPQTAKEKQQRADRGVKISEGKGVLDTLRKPADQALRKLVDQQMGLQSNYVMRFISCPNCPRFYLVWHLNTHQSVHTCGTARDYFLSHFVPPTWEEVLEDVQSDDDYGDEGEHRETRGEEPGQEQAQRLEYAKKRGLGLRIIPRNQPMSWTAGERLDSDSAAWTTKAVVKKKRVRYPRSDAPKKELIMDKRGRLFEACVDRWGIELPSQLLAHSYSNHTLLDASGKPRAQKGITFQTVASVAHLLEFEEAREAAAKLDNVWIAVSKTGSPHRIRVSQIEQAQDVIEGRPASKIAAKYTLEDIKEAADARLADGTLVPTHYDHDTHVDRLHDTLAANSTHGGA